MSTVEFFQLISCRLPVVSVFKVVEKRPPIDHCAASHEERASGRLWKDRFRVLVVDDEDLFREGLAFRLRTTCQATVEEAETGWIALEKVNAGDEFDLILMDVSLPDLGGDEVYDAMRARGVASRIVLMSAHEDNRRLAEALDVPFLDKPFDDAALIKIVMESGGEPNS